MVELKILSNAEVTETEFKRQYNATRKIKHNPKDDERLRVGLLYVGKVDGKKIYKLVYAKSKLLWQIIAHTTEYKLKVFAVHKDVLQEAILATEIAYKEKHLAKLVEMYENKQVNLVTAQVLERHIQESKEAEAAVLPIDLPKQ